jgi:hypothetical protein
MRSLFDPLPRPLSTKTLAVLVGVVVLGTAVAVARFLETPPTPVLDRSGTVWAAPSSAREASSPARETSSGWRSTPTSSPSCGADPRPGCAGTASSTTAQPSEMPALFEPPAQGS